MKAIQITAPSEMKVVDIEKPVLEPGEVLVKIKYVGFCGSDLNTFLGRNPMVKLPVIKQMLVKKLTRKIEPTPAVVANISTSWNLLPMLRTASLSLVFPLMPA